MSESHTEPHVSGQELRAALAPTRRSRPNPLMEPPAWEWNTDEQAQAELDELRAAVTELEEQVEHMRISTADARAREREVRQALRRLAGTRPWRKRGVVTELAGRGLL